MAVLRVLLVFVAFFIVGCADRKLEQAGDVRPLEVTWEVLPYKLSGTINLTTKAVYISDENGGRCEASSKPLTASTGIWSVVCENGRSAKGNYQALGAGKGARGSGSDDQGNSVDYVIGTK
ncbi:hypothetical protein [Kiloniella sp. b19]|uniref:hypothetical protein n=1 Tax=Kiloniella sp. GXU_MW_B19 TaxID=3141326 RepID=UPI0031DB64D4